MRTTDAAGEHASAAAHPGWQPASTRGRHSQPRILQGVALTSVLALALTACRGAAHERGLRRHPCRAADPPLSTVINAVGELVGRAVDRLLQLRQGENVGPVVLQTAMVKRASG